MMKKINLLLIFFYSLLNAQSALDTHKNFPFDGKENPITLRVKIILLEKNDGTGNFNLKDATEKQILTEYLENTFKKFQNIVPPKEIGGCYDGSDFIPDAKIRFVYDIIEVRNTYAWNFLNTGSVPEKNILKGFSPSENWYLKKVDDSLTTAHQNKQGIHIYFTMNGKKYDKAFANKSKNYDPYGVAAGQFPTQKKLNRSSQIHIPDVYLKYLKMRHQIPQEYKKPWKTVRRWFVDGDARGLAHEIGHVFGLYHSNEHHRANQCKYSLMSQQSSAPRNYLQPTEIRKIHYNLSATNLMNFVVDDASYNTTHTIYTNEVWNKKRRFYYNFKLAKKVKLEINNIIIMPFDATFELKKKAEIIFKNKGKIIYPDGSEFKGWKLHRRAKITKKH